MKTIEASQLSKVDLGLRYISLGAVLASFALLFLYAGGWLTPRALTPAKMINTFEQTGGTHPGFRRNHAKGVGVSGYFEANGNGVALSKAEIFQSGRVPVLGRFALAGGQPYQADMAHTVRSLALLFKLHDGEEWRTGMNAIPVFPVNSAQGFYDLLLASAPDPATGKPDAAKMKTFFGQHPESAKAMPLIMNYPVSSGFANSTYNSLNAFRFINEAGTSLPVRWAMVPVQPFVPVAATVKMNTNYLFDALATNIHQAPLQWRLLVTIGQPGDATADATIPWPTNRQQVDVGILTIDRIESEATSPARDLNFDPLILPNGIKGSDDPLLSARSAAYSQSFTRREGETKTPSAVSPAETAKTTNSQ
ncbi:MAG TPA: catalase family peroxidase [Verrucomicrobiae bacterium]|jgi:catalase